MLTGNLFRNVFDLKPKTFPTSSGSGTTQVATTSLPQTDAGTTITADFAPDLPGAIPWWGFVLIGAAAAGGAYYYLDKKGTFR